MSGKRRFAVVAASAGMLAFFAIAACRLRPAPPSVSCEGYLWTETVKRGTMPLDFYGTGMLVRARKPQRFIARLTVSDSRRSELQLNQETDVNMRKITSEGYVSHVSPLSSNGMRSLDFAFHSPVPEGVGRDLQVEATIHVGTLENILYVARPDYAHENSSIPIFKLVDNGQRAVRVVVKFGRTSLNTIEVLEGLKEGDKIIPGEMSAGDNSDQIHLK